MSAFDAMVLLERQVVAHRKALDKAGSPAEKSALLRNLSKHMTTWKKTVEKEAAYHESLAMSEAQKLYAGLETA